jgi:hypothetical protein
MRGPEPPVEPPDMGRYMTADCGHEVYNGEDLFEWEGATFCSDCIEDKLRDMTLLERAELLGCEHTVVNIPETVAGL